MWKGSRAHGMAKLEDGIYTGERGNMFGARLLNIKYVLLGFALAWSYKTRLDYVLKQCVLGMHIFGKKYFRPPRKMLSGWI